MIKDFYKNKAKDVDSKILNSLEELRRDSDPVIGMSDEQMYWIARFISDNFISKELKKHTHK